jgi:hypothetical protein
MSFSRVSNDTTLMQIQSGRTVPLNPGCGVIQWLVRVNFLPRAGDSTSSRRDYAHKMMNFERSNIVVYYKKMHSQVRSPTNKTKYIKYIRKNY